MHLRQLRTDNVRIQKFAFPAVAIENHAKVHFCHLSHFTALYIYYLTNLTILQNNEI